MIEVKKTQKNTQSNKRKNQN